MIWSKLNEIPNSNYIKIVEEYCLIMFKKYLTIGLLKDTILEREIKCSDISNDGHSFLRIDKFGNFLYINMRNGNGGTDIYLFKDSSSNLTQIHKSPSVRGEVLDNQHLVLRLNGQDMIGYGVYCLKNQKFLFERRESVANVHLSNKILFSIEIEGFNPTKFVLVALDIYTGAVLWKVKLRDGYDEIMGVHQDKLLCNISGKGCAIDLKTGQIIWQLGLGIRCVDHSQQLAIQYGPQGYNEFNLSTGQIHHSGEYKNKIDNYTFLGNPVAPILYNDFLISPSRTMKRKGEGCGIGFLNRKTLTWDYVIPLEYPVKGINSFYMENDLLYALDMNDTLHIFEREE